MSTYPPTELSFARGEGVRLYDQSGKAYLDGLCGIGVTGLGHAHPEITATITEQASRVLHTTNYFKIESQEALAEALCNISGMEKAFFGNSGAEANEAAIKLARYYGNRHKQVKNPSIIVTEGAFHGRTMATLTAGGNRRIQAGFEPLVGGFVRAPFGDLEALRTIGRNNSDVVAILVEPVQGEGGVMVPPAGYIAGLREVCDEFGWLMMLDEVQTGNGRTGRYFAYQHEDVTPDVVVTAKGLGNGVPIGVCLAKGEAAGVLQPGSHGTTFGGNPLATSVGLTVATTIIDQELSQRAEHLGERLAAGFQNLVTEGLVKELRNKGLMIGLDLGIPCNEAFQMGLDQGLIVNVTAASVIRLLPPLILSDEETDELIDRATQLVRSFHESQQ